MKSTFYEGIIRSTCPECNGAIVTFENKYEDEELPIITLSDYHEYQGEYYPHISYIFLVCANCSRGALAKVHHYDMNWINSKLEWFFPNSYDLASLPEGIPDDIVSEYREAEKCASVDAYRAACAMLRSCLEKVFKANGYNSGNLKNKIEKVCEHGIITAARKNKADEDVRVLGNNILHDDWRVVDYDEYKVAHHYLQRILEDFYDDRAEVEKILKKEGLIS